jgi:hypothetical protein
MNYEHTELRPLRPSQVSFVDAYVTLGDVPAAARFVGVDRSTGWRWLQLPQVRDELASRMQERRRLVEAALLDRQAAAFVAIDGLLASPDEKVRLRIATWIVDNALKRGADTVPAKTFVELQFEALERQAMNALGELPPIEEATS